MPKTEKLERQADRMWLVPELEIRISESWIRLIRYCQTSLPNGQLCFKVNNAEPGRLVSEHTKRDIRFDKEQDVLIDFGEL